MQWVEHSGPSALSGVTGDKTIYTVHLLEVKLDDDLMLAFRTFWKDLLTYALKNESPDWDILLVELRTLNGMVVGYLTSQNQENDQPHIYKIRSAKMEEEDIHGEEETEDAQFEMINKKYWDLLQSAVKKEEIQELLSKIRANRELPIWGIEYTESDTLRLLKI